MASEQPESRTEKAPETVFQMQWRQGCIAAMGLLGIALLVLFTTGCLEYVLPLTFFGVALLLMPLALLVRNVKVRVVCVTLLLLIATELTGLLEYGIYQAGGPLIEGITQKEVNQLYEQIQNGMTRQNVVALLGQPRYFRFEPNQSKGSVESWRYAPKEAFMNGPLGNWDYLEVCFSAEGKVVYKYLGD